MKKMYAILSFLMIFGVIGLALGHPAIVNGKITFEDGAPVGNIPITITNLDSEHQESINTITNVDGEFNVDFMEKEGFEKYDNFKFELGNCDGPECTKTRPYLETNGELHVNIIIPRDNLVCELVPACETCKEPNVCEVCEVCNTCEVCPDDTTGGGGKIDPLLVGVITALISGGGVFAIYKNKEGKIKFSDLSKFPLKKGQGMKIYRNRADTDNIIQIKHPKATGYHNPKIKHRNPEARHDEDGFPQVN